MWEVGGNVLFSRALYTMVGYSGGKELNPTYRRIKDHTESVLIEFDPNVLSFEDVLIEVRFRDCCHALVIRHANTVLMIDLLIDSSLRVIP
jgi:hypothetical protein